MEMQKTFDKLRDMIGSEMEQITSRGEFDENSLACTYKMVDILKDLGEIEMNDGGYSQRYMPQYPMNSYGMGGGNSYRNNNTMYRGNSYRNNYNGMNGGYSRTGDTMDKLHQMMNEAQTEHERETIRRVMETM